MVLIFSKALNINQNTIVKPIGDLFKSKNMPGMVRLYFPVILIEAT